MKCLGNHYLPQKLEVSYFSFYKPYISIFYVYLIVHLVDFTHLIFGCLVHQGKVQYLFFHMNNHLFKNHFMNIFIVIHGVLLTLLLTRMNVSTPVLSILSQWTMWHCMTIFTSIQRCLNLCSFRIILKNRLSNFSKCVLAFKPIFLA